MGVRREKEGWERRRRGGWGRGRKTVRWERQEKRRRAFFD